MKKLVLLFVLSIPIIYFAQEKVEPIVWKAAYINGSAHEGEIVFSATIADKWHLFSQRPSDVIPVPTSFTITPGIDFQMIDKVIEIGVHEEFEKVFEAKLFVFEKEAVFKQKLTRKNDKAFTIYTSLEYIACNDIMCLPPSTLQFSVIVPEISSTKK